MKSFIQHAIICITLLLYLTPGLATDTQGGLTVKKNSYMKKSTKLDRGQEKKATLVLLASELLSRTKENDDISLVIATKGSMARFECTGNSDQSIAACGQRCLAIQSEFESTNASQGGCSSINNGCQCTSDPFE